MVIVCVATVEFVQFWSVTTSVTPSVTPAVTLFGVSSVVSSPNPVKLVTFPLAKSVKSVMLAIVGVVGAAIVGVGSAGQEQQYLFGEGVLNTGQPGYQFWKVRGSPLAQRDQGILELLLVELLMVELSRFLRRPTQQSEAIFRAMVWMFSGVRVTRSLKQT